MSLSKVLDVFPQVLRVDVAYTAGTYTEVEVPTGLAALRALEFRKNKRTAMEVMKLKIFLDTTDDADDDEQLLTLSTVSRAAMGDLSDRGVLHKMRTFFKLWTTGATCVNRSDIDIDLTAGGIGRLVASDNLYIGVNSVTHAGAMTLHCQIVFRYVSISLQEFSDLKESQITYE